MQDITSPRGAGPNALERTSMRVSATQPRGGAAAYIHEARVIDFNLRTFTVDVRTQFDNRKFLNVQVSSPYLNAARGEGFYVVPESQSKCLLCIPSDGAPFVLAFIMPMETPEDGVASDQAAADSVANASPGAGYTGGRTRGKPGDQVWRGRDGNFVVLHRGGVLQLGASELAQRIYIPLGNIVTDISQEYEHHNTGGGVLWGLTADESADNPGTCHRQMLRVHANDAYADIRVSKGHVRTPAVDGGDGAANSTLGIGEAIVFEVALAAGGFDAGTGAQRQGTRCNFRMFFDAKGGTYLYSESSINLELKGSARLSVGGDLALTVGGSAALAVNGALRIQSAAMRLVSEAPLVINGGSTPVATVGSFVDIVVVEPVPILVGTTPGVISSGAVFKGVVSTGCPSVLVPGV